MKSFIITPTYNEKDNIRTLIAEIRKHLPDIYVLIVDDNSPDGTGLIADAIAEKDKRIFVLHRSFKNGFGRAYRDGVKYVFDKFPDTDVICWMDADLSHNPCYLPEFIKELSGCDMIIGSRYIKEGGVQNWPWYRRFLSWGGNLYARTVSGLKIHDCTAGFILFKSHVLQNMDFNSFHTQGYSFLIEIKAACQKKGYTIKEHPIIFEERQQGSSKLTMDIIKEAFWNVWKIRRNS